MKKAYEDQHPDGKFQVVYVSSDRNEEEMTETFNSAHGSWNCVPFDSADRNGMKRHFGACAGKEVRELGLAQGERKYGIPTLIIIDSKSEEVLSYEGVRYLVQGDLLQEFGIGAK